jgi:hypothetical protein
MDCVVQDISVAGAGLASACSADLPEHVELTIDGGRTFRPATIAWRLMGRAGLKFDNRA